VAGSLAGDGNVTTEGRLDEAPNAEAGGDLGVQFVERYTNNPLLAVREWWGAEPDDWQQDVLVDVGPGGQIRVTIRSGHGVGKTTLLAWIIVWHLLTRFPQKTVVTAATEDQLYDALVAEIKTWISKLPQRLQDLIEVKSESIHLKAAPNESFVSFRNARPEKPEALAGVHSTFVLLIADEASGVHDDIFEAGLGSMSGHNAITILTGNPIRSSGFFYKTHRHKELRDRWKRYKVSGLDSPRVSQAFVDEIIATYGERSNQYRVRVLGEFPLAAGDIIIPAEWVEAALNREVEPTLVQPVWGVDVGRFGDDPSALAKRRGNVLLEPVTRKYGFDTMKVAGWIKHEWDTTPNEQRPSEIMVDEIGIGAGVVDRLRELGLPVRGINVSEQDSVFDEQYVNVRTELWFKGKGWFGSKNGSLRGDEETADEFKAQTYDFNGSGGKIIATSKKKLKGEIGGSPNGADAFLLTLATETVSAIQGSSAKRGTSWSKPLRREIKGIV
jgi:phage terminase large subunit